MISSWIVLLDKISSWRKRFRKVPKMPSRTYLKSYLGSSEVSMGRVLQGFERGSLPGGLVFEKVIEQHPRKGSN